MDDSDSIVRAPISVKPKAGEWGSIDPPPWPLGENESLDIAYYKAMRKLAAMDYTIVRCDEAHDTRDCKKIGHDFFTKPLSDERDCRRCGEAYKPD